MPTEQSLDTGPFAAAQDFVRWVKDQELDIVEDENDRRRRRSANYHQDVKRNLDNPAQVLPELIQNADDLDVCEEVTIELTTDTLRVCNDGRAMTCEEVDTLCAVGDSTKRDPRFIGHFGRGFKSVFSISDNPRVRSGWFRFIFSKDQMTVPEPLDAHDEEYIQGTEIIMPLSGSLTSSEREQLENRLDEVHRLLPYLRNVSSIIVKQEQERHKFEREKIGEHRLRILKDGDEIEQRAVFTTEESPTSDALTELTDKRDIDDVDRIRESPIPVTLSFRVDTDGTPQPDMETNRLFNFLPTQEEPGLPFDIQADFLLKADRENLTSPEGSYNQWLLGRVGDVYRLIIRYYRDHEKAPVGHLNLLSEFLSLENYPEYIENARVSVLEALNDERSILTRDNEYRRPADVIVPSEYLESLFTQSDIEHLLSESISFPHKLLGALIPQFLDVGTLHSFDIPDLFEQADEEHLQSFGDLSQGVLLVVAATLEEYWQNNYRSLSRYDDRTAERDQLLSILRRVPLLPLTDGHTVSLKESASEPILPPHRTNDTYAVFNDEFLILNITSEAVPDTIDEDPSEVVKQARSFYRKTFELDSLDVEVVLNRVVADAFNKPESTDDQVLDEYLRFIFNDKSRWSKAAERVSLKLRVRGSADRYHSPTEDTLYLPDAYDLPYSLEKILRGVDVDFVSEEYLGLTDDVRSGRWREFLTTFGVKERLHVKEMPPRQRQFFIERDDLVDELDNHTDSPPEDGWTIPESQTKGGQYDQWFRKGRRYALSDIEPDDDFSEVLDLLDSSHDSNRDVYEQAAELVAMVDEYWVEYAESIFRPLYYVTRPSQKYEVNKTDADCSSTFGRQIRETAWFPTRATTLAPPRTLLVETLSTSGQEPERYIGVDPSSLSLNLESLGVRDQLGLETTLELLQNAPRVWQEKDPSTIRRAIREHLDTLRSEIKNESDWKTVRTRLKNAPFVYVEDANPEFRSVDEIVWRGRNLESAYVSIKDEYERQKELFENLGIDETVSAEHYLAYLRESSWNTLDDVERVWRRTVQGLNSEIKDVTEQADLFDRLSIDASNCRLLTGSDQVRQITDIDFYCQDNRLYSALDKDTAARTVRPVKGGQLADETIANIWTLFGFDDLSEDVELEITSVDTNSSTTSISSDEDFSQLLNVAYSFCTSEGYTDAADKVENIVITHQVETCSELRVQYKLDQPITDRFSVNCAIDERQQTIYRTDEPKGLFEVARQIPNILPLRSSQRENLRTLLSGALGKEQAFLESYLQDQGVESRRIDISKETESSASSAEQTSNRERDSGNEMTEDTSSGEGDKDTDDSVDDQAEERSNPETRIAQSTSTNQSDANGDAGDTKTTSATNGDSTPSELTGDTSVKELKDGTHNGKGENRKSTTSAGEDQTGGSGSRPTGFSVNPREAAASGLELRRRSPSSAKQKSTGGGGAGSSTSGGRSANQYGKWGEDTVFQWVADIVEGALEEQTEEITVTDEWSPLLQGGSDGGFQCPCCDQEAPGQRFEIENAKIMLLHVREHDHGADILLFGASLSRTSQSDTPLEVDQIGANESTWLEVKTTGGTSRSFDLSLNEYSHAFDEPEDYYFLRICGAGDDPYLDTIISDISTGVDDGSITIEEQSFRLKYQMNSADSS